MEWLSQVIESIVRSQVWRFVATHFFWLDWITVALVLWGLVQGLKNGLVRMLVKSLELLLIAWVTLFYREPATSLLRSFLSFLPSVALPAAGFVIVALPLTAVIFLIDSRAVQLFHTNIPAPVRGIGGAAAGVFYGLFLWSFLSQAVLITPVRSVQKDYDNGISVSGRFIKDLAPGICRKIRI